MNKKLNASSKILENEIEFADEVIIENKDINAYISSAYIDLNKKFGLKYEKDSYYDIYLNYKYLENKMYIEIVKVGDEDRQYYTYNPTTEEGKMLIEKLDRYIENLYKQNIKQFIDKANKLEEEQEME